MHSFRTAAHTEQQTKLSLCWELLLKVCSLNRDPGVVPLTCGGLEADSCAIGLNHPKDLSVLLQSSHACRDQRSTSEEGMASAAGVGHVVYDSGEVPELISACLQ